MGNIISPDGIISGPKITKQCVDCEIQFETSWSDQTMNIKGQMISHKRCIKCRDEYFIKIHHLRKVKQE